MNKHKAVWRLIGFIGALAAIWLSVQFTIEIANKRFIDDHQCRKVGEAEHGKALWFCDSDGKVYKL